MLRVLTPLALFGVCCLCSAADPPQKGGPVQSKPAPAIPINPERYGKEPPRLEPLPRVPVPGEAKPAPAPAPERPLPRPDARGAVFLDNLQLFVKLNAQGVVEVVGSGKSPVSILVARNTGLSRELFVPGDTIYGFGGHAIASIDDLHELSRAPGWHYVEGICNGANAGKAYIGRVYIEAK